MARSELERRAEQTRAQIEDLRSRLAEILHRYNVSLGASAELLTAAQTRTRRAVQQARRRVQEVGEELAEAGLPWWVPVAAITAIGLGFVVAYLLGLFGLRPGRLASQPFAENRAGYVPTQETAG